MFQPKPPGTPTIVATVAILALLLAGCATTPAPVAPPAPPPVPAKPTTIVMDPADHAALQVALRDAALRQVNDQVQWSNPASGKSGAVRILRDGYDGDNRLCREFHSVVRLDTLSRHATGFICRGADGGWEVTEVKDYPPPVGTAL